MCAPASVTALHQMVIVNTVQAYTVSHIMGMSGIIAAGMICFRGSVAGFLSKMFSKFGR